MSLVENGELVPLEVRLARRIKNIRQSRDLTQKELAESCGMSNQTVNNIETGKSDFRISTLDQLSNTLGFSVVIIPDEDL